jgi:hypothetical protein
VHDWAVSLAAWRESHDKPGGEVNESTPIMAETLDMNWVAADLPARFRRGCAGSAP